MDIIDVLSREPLELIAAILGVILLVLAINSKRALSRTATFVNGQELEQLVHFLHTFERS